MNNSGTYLTDVGAIRIEAKGDTVVGLYFENSIPKENNGSIVTDRAALQINNYLCGKSETFSIKYVLHGTDFQMKVWQALLTIPYGEKRTYKQIAEQIGHPKAARAVGNACNSNPISIVVPCHRVVHVDNSLSGYGGGVEIKKKLLRLEQRGIHTEESRF